MLDTLASAWKLEDLRKKIFFTLLMFVVFRLGAHVPVPGINNAILKELIGTGTIFGFFDVISGGAFKRFTIFAMGIMPYINASIIMQLLTVVIPALERLAKEDIEGRKKNRPVYTLRDSYFKYTPGPGHGPVPGSLPCLPAAGPL